MGKLRHYIDLVETEQLDEKGWPKLAKAAMGAGLAGAAAFGGHDAVDAVRFAQSPPHVEKGDLDQLSPANQRYAAWMRAKRDYEFKKAGVKSRDPVETEREVARRAGRSMGRSMGPSMSGAATATSPQPMTAHVRPGQVAAPQALKTATPEDKEKFVKKMVPGIHKANAKLKALRKKILQLAHKKSLNASEQAFIDQLCDVYRVKNRDLKELLTKVAPIPASLVLAQSAIESGWGLSRLAQTGNVMFGQKDFSKDKKPTVSATEDGTKYTAFKDAESSVSAYMRNLNSHPAYADFRRARDAKLAKGEPLKGEELAPTLTSYSTRGADYTGQVQSMIGKAGFNRFDG